MLQRRRALLGSQQSPQKGEQFQQDMRLVLGDSNQDGNNSAGLISTHCKDHQYRDSLSKGGSLQIISFDLVSNLVEVCLLD